MKTIKELYKHSSTNNAKLLSNYDADFWDDYNTNYAIYDSVFKRLYSSFVFFEQEEDETVQEVVANFADAVKGHLMMNSKKYSELYRVNVLSDDDYDLTSNVNIEETMDKDNSYAKGARTDSSNSSVGSQTVTDKKEVSPYDSENFYNDTENTQTLGARTDSNSFTSGGQNDSSTEDYTLTKKGNDGNVTSNDMLQKHKKFWDSFEFYSYIFGEIAKELLLTGC